MPISFISLVYCKGVPVGQAISLLQMHAHRSRSKLAFTNSNAENGKPCVVVQSEPKSQTLLVLNPCDTAALRNVEQLGSVICWENTLTIPLQFPGISHE